MNVCSIWPFAQISDDFYYLDINLAMCQIFCSCIIQGVSFNYHHRNVRSQVSNFQVSVSAFMTRSRSRNLSQVSEVTVSTDHWSLVLGSPLILEPSVFVMETACTFYFMGPLFFYFFQNFSNFCFSGPVVGLVLG